MFEQRLYQKTLRPADPHSVQAFMNVMKQAAPLGYNGVLVRGSAFATPLEILGSPACMDAMRQVIAEADKLNMLLIPVAQHQTEVANARLDQAEAIRSQARYVVHGSRAVLVPRQSINVKNLGFEEGLSGWRLNHPSASIDSTVARSGRSSLRIKNPGTPGIFVRQIFKTAPYSVYEVSVHIKTAEFESPRDLGVGVLAHPRWIFRPNEHRGVKSNQDWTKHTRAFNCLFHSSVSLVLFGSDKTSSKGNVWYDDVQVREVGLYEPVIRENTRPGAYSISGNIYTQLKEGTDYKIAKGEVLIPSGSAIKDKDTIHVDWYKLADMLNSTPPAALCHQEGWDIVESNMALGDKVFGYPCARMMNYTGWEVAGHDPQCFIDHRGSVGSYFAHAYRETEALYRKANSDRLVYAWSDELDPYHNARYSFLRNGTGIGSWKGLSDETIVLNWNAKDRAKSLSFFAGNDPTEWRPSGTLIIIGGTEGPDTIRADSAEAKTTRQRQILSATNNGAWRNWIYLLDSLENAGLMPDGSVIGINYMATDNNYDRLPDMAAFCRDAGRWGNGPIECTPTGISRPGQACKTARSMTLSVPSANTRRITYFLPAKGHVRLTILNAFGQQVATLVNREMPQGSHRVALSLKKTPAGIYFVRLTAGDVPRSITRKVVLL